ncbi:MAG: Vi polysaccharide biosynthesis protein VipA/TviB [Candidatus Marinimicrobia bacterium]|nr:Vi polysaccharide biosynthesis protein VipA/TviB [Candidatus Neomarinimicrobiota bacterium]
MSNNKIAILGLGYVGLPLLIAFSRFYEVIGFDISSKRINDIKSSTTINNKSLVNDVFFTSKKSKLSDANIYIITVPTPLNEDNSPDLSKIKLATEIVAQNISQGNIVIYESTVYPGVTEDFCVPIIEKISKLNYNKDFYCGYSPERISPGDERFTLNKMIKITSGSTPSVADFIDDMYKKIIGAGTYKASSIKVAEAAKVIENIQRDVNIALINELAIIFDGMNLNTNEILEAAKTKSNFIPFKPGLVGGHCISVDPYYLSYKSMKLGVNADIINVSRKINDNMSNFIVDKTINILIKKNINIINSDILILGYTFKENCADTRNTKVKDIIYQLMKKKINIEIYDPYVENNNDFNFIENPFLNEKKYDCIIVAVSHNQFKNYKVDDFIKISKGKLVLLDIKGMYNFSTWKL